MALIEKHLSQFGSVDENQAMLTRLKAALADGRPITGADASFYMHEATEATLMKAGMSYEDAHAAALAKYGVSPYSVYDPDVIARFPEAFNEDWANFWANQ